jgi:hypothetical protein
MECCNFIWILASVFHHPTRLDFHALGALCPLTWLASVFKYVITFGFAATLMFPPAIGDIPENKEIKQKD